MEQVFQKAELDCMRPVVEDVHNEEQTQEVRLPDAMPDIGRVLGAWGQVVIRSKEWRGGSMSVSGGVMAWALYEQEGGGAPQSVEAWIPFQMHWDFPETQRDGTVLVSCLLRNVDARSISARKLLIRVCMSVAAKGLEPATAEYPVAENVPEDVQLLRRSYPIKLPKEAGEKTFLLEEDLTLPSSAAKLEKAIYYTLSPQLLDRKIMADKVVFRGTAIVHILYCSQDGTLQGWDFEVPFSQYTDLAKEYEPSASVDVIPVVTSLEVEQSEQGTLHLKAGMTGQYVVYAEETLPIVEDAYSPRREVTAQNAQLEMPAILDFCRETLHLEQMMQMEGGQLVDVFFCTEHPAVNTETDEAHLAVSGTAQVLYYDHSGVLQGSTTRCEGKWDFPCASNGKICARSGIVGSPQASLNGAASVRCDVAIDAAITERHGMPAVTGLKLGEMEQPDPTRPSLIVRRAGREGLWTVAKQSGSTVESILKANGLTDEPGMDQILLIPIQ